LNEFFSYKQLHRYYELTWIYSYSSTTPIFR